MVKREASRVPFWGSNTEEELDVNAWLKVASSADEADHGWLA